MYSFVVALALLPFGSSLTEGAPCIAELRHYKCLRRGELTWLMNASIYSLLSDPKRFVGYSVELYGFLSFRPERNVLYVDRSSYDYAIRQNGVWLDGRSDATNADLQALEGKLVRVLGRVRLGPCGHFGGYATCIQIERIESAERRRHPQPRR